VPQRNPLYPAPGQSQFLNQELRKIEPSHEQPAIPQLIYVTGFSIADTRCEPQMSQHDCRDARHTCLRHVYR
jgi:hypothetical protein